MATAQRLAGDGFLALRDAAQGALEAGRLDDAAAFFHRLTQEFPERPIGTWGLAQVAERRADWPAAAALWGGLLAGMAAPPSAWVRGGAWAMAKAGEPEAAAALVAAARARAPDDSDLIVADALVAGAAGAWDRAVACWDEAFGRFPDLATPNWRATRAHALDKAGLTDRAIAAYRTVLEETPQRVDIAVRYLVLLGQANPPDAALAECTTGLLRDQGHYDLAQARARLALRCDDMDCLRATVPVLIDQAACADHCTLALESIAPAFDGRPKWAMWLRLEQRVAALRAAAAGDERGALDVVALRLLLGMRDWDAFLAAWPDSAVPEGEWRARFTRAAEVLRAPRFPDHDAPKVFGIGLSKTGTTSLGLALEQLGMLTAHYRNPFSGDLITPEDAFLFDALTDTPVNPDFEGLFHLFPNSRFVYTTRPLPDWLKSKHGHDARTERSADFAELDARVTRPGLSRYGSRRARSAVMLYYRHGDAARARAAWEERVFGFFSGARRERLLVLDIFSGQGWPELCGFLGVPVPDEAFPWENRAA